MVFWEAAKFLQFFFFFPTTARAKLHMGEKFITYFERLHIFILCKTNYEGLKIQQAVIGHVIAQKG